MRWSEAALSIYFIYAAALAILLPVSAEVRIVSVVLNLTVLAGYALLIYAHAIRGRKMLGVMRDWLPLVLVLLAYREMGWFAPRTHSYSLERSWIVIDRLVLRTWHLHDAIEWLGPVVYEYYAATEGGGTFVDSEEWLRKDIVVKSDPLLPEEQFDIF